MRDTKLVEGGPIKALYTADGDTIVALDVPRICSISAYEENGELAAVPWFAVKNSRGMIVQRINAAHVGRVHYLIFGER